MKIREIFDAMNVTTSDYANLYCAVKKMYDVIVSRGYQEKLGVYIYINLSKMWWYQLQAWDIDMIHTS